MSLKFNNTTIDNATFKDAANPNGITLCKLIYNGTLVWESHAYGSWSTITAATCTSAGTKKRTCTRTGCGVSETGTIPATGHSWNTPTYSWTGTTSCTATRTCKNNPSHTETSTATITSAVTTPATCTAKGITTYTGKFSDSWATTQTKTAQDVAINSSNHTGSAVNGGTQAVHSKYSCCGATISSTHSYTSSVQTAATCTTKGITKYTCSCGYSYTAQDIPEKGHSWNAATYSWSSDKSQCTATRTCKNDSSHKETETVISTNAITTQHTWTNTGIKTYTATFTKSWASKQTSTESVAALGHNWDVATYSWSDNKSTCTATRTCKNDSSHKETETVHSTSAITTQPTCTATGIRTYTATFTKSWASTQTTTESVSANGHTWTAATCTTPKTCSVCGETEGNTIGHTLIDITYSWDGTSSCTATATCTKCAQPITATATITSAVTIEPTCTMDGQRTYTATFNNSWATTQQKFETIESSGHDWVHTSSVVGTCVTQGYTEYTCSVCGQTTKDGFYYGNHTWEDATCEEPKTCSVCGVTEGSELGHSVTNVTYSWGGTVSSKTCTASGTCSRCSASLSASGQVTSVITRQPTEEVTGVKTYTATFGSVDWAETQTLTEVVPKRLLPPAATGVGYAGANADGEYEYSVSISNDNGVSVGCYLTITDEGGAVVHAATHQIDANDDVTLRVAVGSSDPGYGGTYSMYFSAWNYSDSVKVTGYIS